MNNKKLVVILVHHPDHDDQELYSVKKWMKVVTEGAVEHIFQDQDEDILIDETPNEIQEEVNQIDEVVFRAGGHAEDIALVRAQGLDIDDDNLPAPENIPVDNNVELPAGVVDVNVELGWGWSGIDQRKQLNIPNQRANIAGITNDAMEHVSFVGMFFLLFPKSLLETIIQETNKKLDHPTNLGEFLRWIGLWFLLSTISGFKRTDFWSMKPIELYEGAPYRLNEFMSSTRFEAILSSLTLTKESAPSYKDRFWEVREMIKCWNEHMRKNFIPSWVSCLDESMSIWFNRWTCPGWVYCPRKPHPYGNEYHSICCGLSGIMYSIEMVEGKDRPREKIDPNDKTCGKTGALLLRLTQSIFTTGKVVILDSGFCVLKAIIALRKKGVFASALVKKRRYWPRYVPGPAMAAHMETKKVGECDSLRGTLDGVPYDLFALKEPDYIMKLMSTYGGLTIPSHQRESKRIWEENGENRRTTFQYTEPFANHFNYRHAVDDHNNLRHGLPSIESTIVTHCWPVRVFSFILSITEVNVFKSFEYFVWKKDQIPTSFVKFRKRMAQAFINNDYLRQEQPTDSTRGSKRRKLEHSFRTAPRHASKFVGGRWQKNQEQNTNNMCAKVLVVKNKFELIVLVWLGIGCVKIVTLNT